MKSRSELEQEVNACVLAVMPEGLKQSLDGAIAAGYNRSQLLDLARRLTGGPSTRRGGLTYQMIETYLEAKGL